MRDRSRCPSQPASRERGPDEAEYDPTFSDTTTATYVDAEQRRLVVAIRGTASADDVVTDLSLASNRLQATMR